MHSFSCAGMPGIIKRGRQHGFSSSLFRRASGKLSRSLCFLILYNHYTWSFRLFLKKKKILFYWYSQYYRIWSMLYNSVILLWENCATDHQFNIIYFTHSYFWCIISHENQINSLHPHYLWVSVHLLKFWAE